MASLRAGCLRPKQRPLGLRAGDAVDHQAVLCLKALYKRLGLAAVSAIGRGADRPLDVRDARTGITLCKGLGLCDSGAGDAHGRGRTGHTQRDTAEPAQDLAGPRRVAIAYRIVCSTFSLSGHRRTCSLIGDYRRTRWRTPEPLPHARCPAACSTPAATYECQRGVCAYVS